MNLKVPVLAAGVWFLCLATSTLPMENLNQKPLAFRPCVSIVSNQSDSTETTTNVIQQNHQQKTYRGTKPEKRTWSAASLLEEASKSNKKRTIQKSTQIVSLANTVTLHNKKQTTALALPRNCWSEIASFLKNVDKLSLRQVCKDFAALFYGSTKKLPVIRLNGTVRLPPLLDIKTANTLTTMALSFLGKTRTESVTVTHSASQLFLIALTGAQIKKLTISDKTITDKQLQQILDSCPNLTYLDFDDSGTLTFNNINWGKVQQLKDLHLDDSKINDQGLQLILDYCSHLTQLDLDKCKRLTLHDINWKNQQQLKDLSLNSTKITTQGLQSILDNCSHLTQLDLDKCNHLAFGKINWKNQQQLEDLSLTETAICKSDLLNILNNCPQLTNLDLLECTNLPENMRYFHTSKTDIENLKKALQ
ncbi:TPA: hypothetical protein DDZ86_01030 [Candidatus Dependentiae bacterium]|nr:MAG: hypothetical protein UW09_C0004G0088 [candidate division TM6 bacterium GW2011_GWF2_43_87]HBL98209.1 hypothetical protein [Candidatus Dependentiae bacterium]